MTREELLKWRDKLFRGDPPYQQDKVLGTHFRHEGVAGVDERRRHQPYSVDAPAILLLMELNLALVDHILESERVDEDQA